MASRNPKDLEPKLLKAFDAFCEEFEKSGYDIILTCSYRSNEEQAKLYSIGRGTIGKRVTDAKPGQSKHNKKPAQAFDIAIARYGKCIWDTNHYVWKLAKDIGLKLGLTQLRKESCHFEFK